LLLLLYPCWILHWDNTDFIEWVWYVPSLSILRSSLRNIGVGASLKTW
jgi:hypothetical protein